MESIDFDTRSVFVDGHWQAASFGRTLPLVNPSDGSELTQIARGGPAEIDAAVRAAQAALDGAWGRSSAAERGRILQRMSQRGETRLFG
ncbi:MAG: aldehyde dehydrogenase family protein, partial [Burkholderiaceae bacterium]